MTDPNGGRLAVDVLVRPDEGSTLARDVLEGLGRRPYSIPPKHFYDARGSELFDAICDTPEYYVTRTEQGLLDRVATEIIDQARPVQLAELGSGAARKTRTLIDALVRARPDALYVPLDVSEDMLRRSARALLSTYPSLRVHGLVADYERHLGSLPAEGPRLIALLGSTLGNLTPEESVRFLSNVAAHMRREDRFLLGLDLVKPKAVLDAAYNDADGFTARFNKNVLSVINAQLDADFDPEAFDHVAEYAPACQRVEIRLRARRAHTVYVRRLELSVELHEGEEILTEISRKFTHETATHMLAEAGLALEQWYESPDSYFALGLTRAVAEDARS